MKQFMATLAGTGSSRFSYAQWNIRNVGLAPLGNMARENMSGFITPIWEQAARDRKLSLTGINLFLKEALPAFFASIPNKAALYNVTTNAPLLTSLKVSTGDLEGIASITTATYDTATGKVHCTWPVTFSRNGLATDKVYALVVRKPIIDASYRPSLYLYGNAVSVPAIARSDGTAGADVVTIPTGLTATDLFVYLFTKDVAGTIGFSESVNKVCAAA
jgi:hypothetical protein